MMMMLTKSRIVYVCEIKLTAFLIREAIFFFSNNRVFTIPQTRSKVCKIPSGLSNKEHIVTNKKIKEKGGFAF